MILVVCWIDFSHYLLLFNEYLRLRAFSCAQICINFCALPTPHLSFCSCFSFLLVSLLYLNLHHFYHSAIFDKIVSSFRSVLLHLDTIWDSCFVFFFISVPWVSSAVSLMLTLFWYIPSRSLFVSLRISGQVSVDKMFLCYNASSCLYCCLVVIFSVCSDVCTFSIFYVWRYV